MEKIIFEDLPSTKTPLNAENLNKIQTNAENAINEVDNKFNYSTEEQIIGKWIDGKPIYRKVIDNFCGNLYDLLNKLNIDFLIDASGMAWSNYNHKMPINTPNPDPPQYVLGIYQTASSSTINVFYNSTYFSDTNKVICIVKYTKTVD